MIPPPEPTSLRPGRRAGRAAQRAGRVLRATLVASLLVQVPMSPVSAGEDVPQREADEKKRADETARANGTRKVSARDVSFIMVQADFANTTVTIDGKPYPVHSEVGAIVAPGKLYEVVVTDNRSNTTARYQVQLRAGEARLIMAALASSGPSAPSAPSRPVTRNVPEKGQPEEEQRREEEVAGAGYLTVNATPAAQVYIDGKLVASKTPLVKHKVQPGNHTVRVYYVDDKKFSETKRAMITEGRHVNLYFQNSSR